MILTVDQKVALAIQPVDKYNNPAPVENIVWATSDETVLTVAPSEDGLAAMVVATGKMGTAQISVTADAKIGEGISEIVGVISFDVKGGEAVALGITAGTPEPK